MQELTFEGKLGITYESIIEDLKKEHPDIDFIGESVDVSTDFESVVLSIGTNRKLYMTPEQAVDLMNNLRRAIVKTKPKALRIKGKWKGV